MSPINHEQIAKQARADAELAAAKAEDASRKFKDSKRVAKELKRKFKAAKKTAKEARKSAKKANRDAEDAQDRLEAALKALSRQPATKPSGDHKPSTHNRPAAKSKRVKPAVIQSAGNVSTGASGASSSAASPADTSIVDEPGSTENS